MIEAGTLVNTIAEHASMLLDLRSEDAGELGKLITRTEDMVAEANTIPSAALRTGGDARFTATVVGDRPTSEIATGHPLVVAAAQILSDLGVASQNIRYRIGSTDANILLSRGISAVTTYLTEGHDAHRLSEWLSLESLPQGMTLAWRLMHWAVGWDADGGKD